ncbi:MAG: MBL fold metallo-hydrolase [Christensenellales bacterium]
MPLIIHAVVNGIFATNSYIAYDKESKKGFVVDPSDDYDLIEGFVKASGIDLQAILITHGHFDHIGSAAYFQSRGAKVYMSQLDQSKITNQNNFIATSLNVITPEFSIDCYVDEGSDLHIANNTIQVLNTPGHSKGGVCYVCHDIVFNGQNYRQAIFCGDTIFKDSYGRVDFPDGDIVRLKKSIEKILALQGDALLLPGHGDATFSHCERNSNPIFYDCNQD